MTEREHAKALNAEIQRLGMPIKAKEIRIGDTSLVLSDRNLASIMRKISLGPAAASCWGWRGQIDRHGYARSHLRNADGGVDTMALVHRITYQVLVGPIPGGLTLDHLCRIRYCVNPRHLDPCSMGENSARSPFVASSINRTKTECPRGHSYDAVRSSKGGTQRSCRTCERDATRRCRLRRLAKEGWPP